MMRVIVCGGRDYSDYDRLCEVMDEIHCGLEPVRHLWHGNARGADSLADKWGREDRSIAVHPVPANWKKHGKRAGPIRNQNMLGQEPDLVVAFPGGRGTADMVRRAKKAGVDVVEVDAKPDGES